MIGVLHKKNRPYWQQMERTIRQPFTLFTTEKNVVLGSIDAMKAIAASPPPWVLLQDDMLLRKGWLEALQAKEAELADPKLGMIAGIDVWRNPPKPRRGYVRWVTAQVQYFTAAGLEALQPLLTSEPKYTRYWDSMVCDAMHAAGLHVYLMPDYVGEHIGLQSAVRPQKQHQRSESVLTAADLEG